ncbi:SLC13 family permease [Devosia pacifica]|uniref:SLC13 family permease n=1 Tax=Devosia pacifica TaxID=1335967 RepID=A0A918SAF0_9HYPH|nr:SLC13 family permease [Devosia pacifica]GHA31653.1 SLC13 family permease [Devosia pacifica]
MSRSTWGPPITYEQITLFSLLALVLGLLMWGKFRFDLVSFAALVAAVVLGVVPADRAFSGFSNDATIIVILVLVVSFGLTRSGAVELITRPLVNSPRPVPVHLGMLGGIAAVLSAFMNNVASLALTMPVDIQAAQKAGRSPSLTLMPLAAATILGGLVTLIGTPPNILIASYREQATGEAFRMFDYAPVGLSVAIAGLIFTALVGWRIIPVRASNAIAELAAIENYVSELVVKAKSQAIGQKVADLDKIAEENDTQILGLVRKARRLPGRARTETITEGDLLVVEGSPEALNSFSAALGLSFQGKSGEKADLGANQGFIEAVVNRESRLVGRSANEVQMLRGYGVSLLGISRRGRTVRERVRRTPLQAGDVLLLLGARENMEDVLARLDCLPLAHTPALTRYDKAVLAIVLFASAIALSVFGLLPLTIGLSIVVIAFVLADIVPIRELYEAIEWPIIVLLGALIPIGEALESSGGTLLLANGIAMFTQALPAWIALTAMLVVTMFLSDILNNAATAVIAAPIAYGLATAMQVNPDAFLMAVAIGASCAFLTPIGHQNNLLIMGPGGYQFSDYWKFGLPLEVVCTVVAVPMIILVWGL